MGCAGSSTHVKEHTHIVYKSTFAYRIVCVNMYLESCKPHEPVKSIVIW